MPACASSFRWKDSEDGGMPAASLIFPAAMPAGAAALVAAARRQDVRAGVSRGGRPGLAHDALDEVLAPTLLIVGGEDPLVLDLNRRAQRRMRCESVLEVVPGATHLFEEPGALAEVARLARDWFLRHLASSHRPG